ncbi:TetR/AcrR family transcriptional regulator [Kitasatospora sp. NPDC056184]|uniref:TetR/AcrR family transcriptional regulator n=1 Tax=Kitasatospora sp. NPDC056184 TaxID=3345738 RepID=UPI0035E117BF
MGKAESYHHGNLRRAVLDAALAAIEESGPSGWSLRELARRAGVSHAAPAHHFGDKAGVLTAVAAEGFEQFADALERAAGDPYGSGVAYVRFAVDHRAYFEVMFRPELYRAEDPELAASRERAGAVLAASGRKLSRGAGTGEERATTIAAWSLAHGFASLWLNGALPESRGEGDVEELAKEVLRVVFGGGAEGVE